MSEMIVTVVLVLFVVAMLPMVIAPFLRPNARPVNSSAPAGPRPLHPEFKPGGPDGDRSPMAA